MNDIINIWIVATAVVGLFLAGSEGAARKRWGATVMVLGQLGWIVAVWVATPVQWGMAFVCGGYCWYWGWMAWRAWWRLLK